jgi:hypothetical protein
MISNRIIALGVLGGAFASAIFFISLFANFTSSIGAAVATAFVPFLG